MTTYSATETFIHLGPDGTSVPLPVNATFWEDLNAGRFAHLGPGRLVSTYEFTADWESWEMHPAGEEVVVLLSGAMDMIVGNQPVHLTTPGQFLLIPREVWHTANVAERAVALFITAGDGTEHRSR